MPDQTHSPEFTPLESAQETEPLLPESIRFMDLVSKVEVSHIRIVVPQGDVVTTDYSIQDVEQWQQLRNQQGTLIGYRKDFPEGSITNFDHHSNNAEFFRQFSSANCAIAYVREHGPVTDRPIVIHHTDCDSMLSSLILSGALPPDDRFGEAVIAADHTGKPNQIADLLQSIEQLRDPQFSYEQLSRLLSGKPLDPRAAELLQKRHQERAVFKDVHFTQIGETGVYWTEFSGRAEGAFAPAAVPDAKLIVMGSPMADGRWEIKVRAGNQFPPQKSIQDLGLDSFGGRWNAGSTKRSGGSALNPEAYARDAAEKLVAYLNSF